MIRRFTAAHRAMILFCSFVVAFAQITPASAIEASNYSGVLGPQDYSGQDIYFYSSEDTNCTTDSGAGQVLSGVSLPDTTTSYLDGRKVKELAEKNMERYKHAEEKTKVPWQIIAALHYREAGMASNLSITNGAQLGSGTNVDGVKVGNDANEDAVIAANIFIKMAKGSYDVDVTQPSLSIEELGNAFLAYNRGVLYKKAGKTYLDSPYVMNGFDDQHMDMNWVGGAADPGSSTRGGGKDGNKAGALAVVVYLGGMSLSGACALDTGAVAGNIIATAIKFALPSPASGGTNKVSDATKAYQDALKQYNTKNVVSHTITDCGRFVSTVLRASGVDPDFPEVSVAGALIPYLTKHPEKYEALGSLPKNKLEPGDIVTIPSHIFIYIGPGAVKDKTLVVAEAALDSRVPSLMKDNAVNYAYGMGGVKVWRLKSSAQQVAY